MADIVFNIAKGRVAEFAERVNGNDPTNSVFAAVAILSSGLQADSVLEDYDDLGALLAAANDEATNTGYSREIITSITITTDDTNNRKDIDVADITWTGVATSPGAWGALLFCYDSDSTGGTDSNIVPMTKHDFAVTPDGSDITAQISNIFRAS